MHTGSARLLNLVISLATLSLVGCGTSSTEPTSSATASGSAPAGARSAPAASARVAASSSAASSAAPAAPVLGKPGEGFATVEDAVAAVANAIAREDLKALDVGRAPKELLATAFGACKDPTLAAATDLRPSVEKSLSSAKGKRPLKLKISGEGRTIELKKGEAYADCTASKDLKLRVFGFMFDYADGAVAFGDGEMGVSVYPLGEPARYYIGSPK